jgi:hypothetical protein
MFEIKESTKTQVDKYIILCSKIISMQTSLDHTLNQMQTFLDMMSLIGFQISDQSNARQSQFH